MDMLPRLCPEAGDSVGDLVGSKGSYDSGDLGAGSGGVFGPTRSLDGLLFFLLPPSSSLRTITSLGLEISCLPGERSKSIIATGLTFSSTLRFFR